MEVINGMSGKLLKQWRKNNRLNWSEESRLLLQIAVSQCLSDEDKQLLSATVKACFAKKRLRHIAPARYNSEG